MYNSNTKYVQFEWDPAKAAANSAKHGISFEEASSAFFDAFARIMFDPDHSADEHRFVLLGFSSRARLLVVCHCYRENDEVVRIISARKATRAEAEQYRRYRNA